VNGDVEIVVADDPAAFVAARLADAARYGWSIVLTGGSTPKQAYELAAQLEPDWSKTELWWGDERCVPPDDENSNYGMAKQALLDRLAAQPRAVHRMRGELGKDAGADEYEREVAEAKLDLVLLGMGPDGHVASLYPNQWTLDERDRLVVGCHAHLEPYVDRISLTIPALRSGGDVLFLITGDDKAASVARAFRDDPSHEIPASLVRSNSGRTTAVLDAAAASKL
jgi:6-phosphogluconolactonase